MCGIAGFYTREKLAEKKNILKRMNDKLSHRGPDGEGFYSDDLISFSHKRLAIIDLNERSNQPFKDKENNYILTFNGEIYNYIEIKNLLIERGFSFNTTSDTEVLLNSYIYWGEKLLQKIKGMFAFAIYDKKKKKIFCARDHFGQKPFFYYFKDGNFIFSSELTSLLSHPTIIKEICIKSITKYLHYDSFIYNTTPVKDCYKLLPSEYLLFDIEKRNITRNYYWELNIDEKKNEFKDCSNIFIDKLENSTKLHLRSDVPIALFLSGGIDSTTLAYLAKKKLKCDNITAFNLKFKNETFNENILAQSTADKLSLNLKSYNLEDIDFISELNKSINKIDEPLADLGYIAISFISNFVSREGYKVVISGDGGDELLMGYEPFQKFWLYKLLNSTAVFSQSAKYISKLIPDSYDYMGFSHKMKIFCKALGHPKIYCNSRWISSFLPEEIRNLTISDEDLSNRNIYAYIEDIIKSIKSTNDYDILTIQYQRHFLSNLICNHTDKANMQYSIEARSPFLDPDLFNYTNMLPKKNILNKGTSKIILRNFLEKNLSNETFKSAKKGFTVPMANWIQNELRSQILDVLNKTTVNSIGFLNYEYLYKNVIKPHMDNQSNNHKKIWNIFVLVNWLKNNNLY